MKIIEKLSDMIEEEISDAEKYARCAILHKSDMPKLAELFFRLSNEEMNHMTLLHDAVTGIILDYRQEHGEPPETMLAVYDYLHRKQIEHAGEVKAMQSLYK